MIPSLRTYAVLLTGVAIAPLVSALLPPDERLVLTVLISLVGNGLVLLLTTWDSWRTQPVTIQRSPLHRLSIGRDNPVTLSVRARNQPARIQVRDGFPPIFSVSADTLYARLDRGLGRDLTYTVHPDRRGEFLWGDIQVRQLSPWGLAWRSWRVNQRQTVAVYPDLAGLRELSIQLTLQSTGVIRQMRRLGMGTEFAELREYTTGDDPRFIDWKATARRSRPLVRVLEPDREQTLIILLDRGRLMTAQVQGLSRFDWGLKSTLSLALAGLHRGDRVGVGVFDRQIHTWLPPERGLNHLSRLVDRLTPIQPALLEPDYVGAATTLVSQQTRRALVVLITDIVDATASIELLGAMSRLARRYLPFCVALRDPAVDRCAHTPTDNIADTYIRAVALDLIAQRQLAFAQLKQRGVLVLDAPANQISEQLVDRYLQLKARNQL